MKMTHPHTHTHSHTPTNVYLISNSAKDLVLAQMLKLIFGYILGFQNNNCVDLWFI